MTQAQVIKLIRREIAKTGSLRAQALAWGVSAAYLSDVVNGKRWPGEKILGHLGLKGTVKVTRVFEAAKA